ncbi:MAG: phosphoenolpyruvate synthase [Spirochaetia bacterium]|jgi:DNA-binding response OmpR family regulator|nr:phosphoenolpyruvate synthase [Spirochaetia bacterium]
MEKSSFILKETAFRELMSLRIREILLVCSHYDKFMLDEDGRIDEQLFQEYMALSLHYPPQMTQAATADEANKILENKYFDLVILMLSVGEDNLVDLAEGIKRKYPQKPIILLTPLSTRETMKRIKMEDASSIDYIFSWQGNTNIMLAMVKLLEDRMNVDLDVNNVGVQTIILVEDSVRYYSSYLPVIYETLFKQARSLMKEGLNEWEQTVRMRGRPKILLARSYEEALSLYEKYKKNILGIISDIAYLKNGEIDNEAGLTLCSHIRKENNDIPVLLQSSQLEHREAALQHGASFIHKHTKNLLKELENYIRSKYGFGDFIFRNPETLEPIGSATNLKDLQKILLKINDDSFTYHVKNNEISKWLKARALFNLANYLRPKTISDFPNIDEMKQFIYQTIKEFRTQHGRGIIAEFNSASFDELTFFSRIGSGSLGGKGRGLAFVDQQLKKNEITNKFNNVIISIPRTIVLTTEVFDDFMLANDLYIIALSEDDDKLILNTFLKAKFSKTLLSNMDIILENITQPIAIRSSSLLEDSHYQPFAGIYSTYMLPNNGEKLSHRRKELCKAIKSVYASTYLNQSKDYMKATNNIVEDEKMAVIIQEITGNNFQDKYYPNISGVARSLNFYPIGSEKAEEGIVNIAFGLGKTVVDGGISLRFSPSHPKKIIQLSNPSLAMKNSQKKFYALDMKSKDLKPRKDDGGNLLHLDIEKAENDKSLHLVASSYDFENNRLRDGIDRKGKKFITFSSILKYSMFPLAEICKTILKMGQDIMNVPIEIEFAVNLNTEVNEPEIFSFLQIRPIVKGSEGADTDINTVDFEKTLIYSEKAMGNGVYENIKDLIYIKPDSFDPGKTKIIGKMISGLNAEFKISGNNYILVVPGRLGSTDPWLGIPIAWTDISNARIITETGTSSFRVEPSQGTHFFQNITSLGCAYLTINPYVDDGIFDTVALSKMNAVFENEFIRHIQFEKALDARVDGRSGKAVVSYNLPG